MRAGCVICCDLFALGADVSATPCGHTFHTHCLLQWLETSKSCPQCRQKTTIKNVIKLYFDSSGNEPLELDADALQNKCNNLEFNVKIKQQEMDNVKEQASKLTKENKGLREEYKKIESERGKLQTTISAMRTQLNDMSRLKSEMRKQTEIVNLLTHQIDSYKCTEKILSGVQKDIDDMIVTYNSASDITGLVTTNILLNKEFSKAVEDKNKLRRDLRGCEAELKKVKITAQNGEQLILSLKREVNSLECSNNSLKKKISSLQEAFISPSGDAKTSALHRLISESPAPMCLKRPRSEEEDAMSVWDSLTPQVLRNVSKQVAKKSIKDSSLDDTAEDIFEENFTPTRINPLQLDESQEESPYFQLKTSAPYNIPKKPLASACSNNISSQKFSIFGKSKSLTEIKPGLSRNNSSSYNKIGYNGFGGHHKVDEFPKPRPHNASSKVTSKKLSKTAKSNSIRPQNSNIKVFFKNTFDDN